MAQRNVEETSTHCDESMIRDSGVHASQLIMELLNNHESLDYHTGTGETR